MPLRLRHARRPLVMLVGILLAAGCGGAAAVPEPRRFTLVLDDFLIRPQSAQVPAGRLTLTVVNRGRIAHDLRIMRGPHTLVGVRTLKPGVRATVSLRLPAGRYRLVCSIPQHAILGQYGALAAR